MQLTDAVVLVTGASAGIGHAAAVRFATRGARVLVHGRDPERTQKVAGEARGWPLVADLASSTRDSSRLAAVPMPARGHDRYLPTRSPTPWSWPWSATARKCGRRGGCVSPRPCARWLPARFDGARSASAGQLEVTTQRNPMCVVALSCDWGERAAGR